MRIITAFKAFYRILFNKGAVLFIEKVPTVADTITIGDKKAEFKDWVGYPIKTFGEPVEENVLK